jgi:hypothetical protein
MRKALRGDIMKGYFASPLAMMEMSIEDMLLEIPTDDLRHVGTIKDRIYMPAHFVRKWVLPTIQVRKALQKLEDKTLPGGIKTAMLYSIMTNRSWISTDPPARTSLRITHCVLWWHMPKMIP